MIARRHQPSLPNDPIGWTAATVAAFAAMVLWRLTTPTQPFFDEVHYLPAARAILALSHPANPEHPPLGKELIAVGMALLGDRAAGWRAMPALFGVIGLFAAMRALWFASRSRFATVAFGILLATAIPLFVHARIAMLDVFMCAFLLVALWMCAAAVRENETARWRLALAGIALGCAMASKWNAIPLAALPGLAFLTARTHAARWRFLTTSRAAPVRGMTLIEAGLWLGALPLATYALSYWPNLLYARDAIAPGELIELQRRMLDLQGLVVQPHTYQSTWYEWVGNWRAIWYLYEEVDGAQRGVMLVGNPLSMLLGLPAMAWCAWAGFARRRWDALAVFVLYAVSLGMWIVAPKPVQFYYHYLLPSCFLMAALALALAELRQRGWRRVPLAVIAASCALFAWFWPILTAAPLEGPQAFTRWTWLDSWR